MAYQLKGNNGVLIKRKIFFDVPKKDVVIKVGETVEDIITESIEVLESGDFILIRGYLNKSIKYFTTSIDLFNNIIEKKENEKDNEKEEKEAKNNSEDNKKKKELVCDLVCSRPEDIAVDGVIRHTTLWIPFEILINIEGVEPSDNVFIDKILIKSLFKEHQTKDIIEDGSIVGVLISDFISANVIVKGCS